MTVRALQHGATLEGTHDSGRGRRIQARPPTRRFRTRHFRYRFAVMLVILGLQKVMSMRTQGGRVYDSAIGVTCHWCRQKTVEAKVSCTHPGCGNRSLPVSFCRMCLRNRHGEDVVVRACNKLRCCFAVRATCTLLNLCSPSFLVLFPEQAAEESGAWVCPRCRGTRLRFSPVAAAMRRVLYRQHTDTTFLVQAPADKAAAIAATAGPAGRRYHLFMLAGLLQR